MEEAAREVNLHHQLMYHREESRQPSKVAIHHREAALKEAEAWEASAVATEAAAWEVSDNP
jgi:hypothetical protein